MILSKFLKYKFNVFHVRALYYTKTLITNKFTKSFFQLQHTPTCFDPAGSSSGRTFCCRYTRVALLQLCENMLLSVYCVVLGCVNSLWSRLASAKSASEKTLCAFVGD
jgi:hypothetical protein